MRLISVKTQFWIQLLRLLGREAVQGDQPVRILAEPTSTVSDPDPIILKDSDPSFFLNTVNPAGSDPYQVCFLRLDTVYTDRVRSGYKVFLGVGSGSAFCRSYSGFSWWSDPVNSVGSDPVYFCRVWSGIFHSRIWLFLRVGFGSDFLAVHIPVFLMGRIRINFF